MAKRVKVGSKAYRAFRRIGILTALLTVVASVALMSLMVIDILGFNLVENEEGIRTYWVQFETEERVIMDTKYKRGEKLDIPPNPMHSEDGYYKYDFRGWDMSGDNVPDVLPTHAYYSFLAIAVWQKTQIKPIPRSSSEEESSEPEDSSLAITYVTDIEVSESGK